ncbi:hypothetical protein [Microbacterium sp.]|uniref:hypothetical protein n=1 Tax=Microbacterium sp. TaxID=51671 RepID=UPI002619CEB7|nr:hypothetical protein [Microbacterium sp.]
MDDLITPISARTDELITLTVLIVGVAAGYGKAFGGYQTTLTQWVIDAFNVAHRFRGLTNLAVGVAIAAGFSIIAARMLGTWEMVAVGIFAGFLASVEAGRKHDEEAVVEPDDEPPRRMSATAQKARDHWA